MPQKCPPIRYKNNLKIIYSKRGVRINHCNKGKQDADHVVVVTPSDHACAKLYKRMYPCMVVPP